MHHGFVRVAAATPKLRVADCHYNAEQIILLLREAQSQSVDIVVFPELCITGYTCGDLFHTKTLQDAAMEALQRILEASKSDYEGLAIVGMPLSMDGRLFNVAVALQKGKSLNTVLKKYLPNYKEFYDQRYFASADSLVSFGFHNGILDCPVDNTTILSLEGCEQVAVSIEICEDLWAPIPPSSEHALASATIICNLSASNETIGKVAYRRQLISAQSGRCIAAYIYSSSGVGESTTDLVYGGHAIIAENGTIINESNRFVESNQLTISDVNIDNLIHDRIVTTTYSNPMPGNSITDGSKYTRWLMDATNYPDRNLTLLRPNPALPFVPDNPATLDERCEEIFQLQVVGLSQRLKHITIDTVAIGVSGGLDSTLALLVTCRAFDRLGISREGILAFSMPGFGTTSRTRTNAKALMQQLGVTMREIDIRQLCLDEWKALNYKPFGIDLTSHTIDSLAEELSQLHIENRHDLTFENVQARIRTNLLMNTAFTIGTGDMSELALGWCTYNADHMSMYNVNVSIPKTLVRFLVRWVATHDYDGKARETLLDIAKTPISPELLPLSATGESQSTEETVGPYELHDYFLYHFLRYGASPASILYQAQQAKFDNSYTIDELKKWLTMFFKRFFASQYKRSCLPDGPKVGTVSLSPRGDWRMPSDAAVTEWLREIDAI